MLYLCQFENKPVHTKTPPGFVTGSGCKHPETPNAELTMTEKRDRSIKIRLTAAEHSALLDRCDRAELARWMRETCLGIKRPGADVPPPVVDPLLLRQLVGIGNNLNQIARSANRKGEPLDRVQIVAALNGIEREIAALRQEYTTDVSQNS